MGRLNSFRMAEKHFEEELWLADLVDLLVSSCVFLLLCHKNKRNKFF